MTLPILFGAFLHSCWLVPMLWLLCLHRPWFSPAMRAGLWWGACAQMLVVWIAALVRSPIGVHSQWLGALWTFGAAWRLLILSAQFRRAHRLVRESLLAPECAATNTVAWLAVRLALRCPPPVRVSPRPKTPALVSLWRPVLVIPDSTLQAGVGARLQMALAHELAHLRRRDPWLGLAPVLAQTLLFFHPCVWVAVREYVLSREEACDAEAVRVTQAAPDEYGAMLLEYVAAHGLGQKQRSPSPHFHALRRRLNAMRIPYQQPKQGPLGAVCSFCVLGAACASVFPMNFSVPNPAQTASAPLAPAVYRVAETPQALAAQSAPVPVRLTPKQPRRIIPHGRVRVASAAAPTPRVWKIARVRTSPRTASVARRIVVPEVETEAPDAVVIAQTASESDASPRPMQVAWDTPLAPSVGTDPTPDPSGMQADLQKMRQELQGQSEQFKKSLPTLSLMDKDDAKRLHDQMQAQFGPQFQQKWKQYDQELRAQWEAQLPAIRAEAEQARREAAQTQTEQFRRMVAEAQKQALLESAQAREQARQQAGLARQQALQELQRELPRIQEQLKKQVMPPVPPLAVGGGDAPL